MNSQQSTDSRCVRTFSDGRQCRMLRRHGHLSLCVFHAREEEQLYETEKLAAELACLSGNLNTGLDINHILSKIFQALAQRKISAREATAFAYIAQLMLQSMPYVKNEIRWATNDADAYYRMIRQSNPAIREIQKSQPAPRRQPSATTETPVSAPDGSTTPSAPAAEARQSQPQQSLEVRHRSPADSANGSSTPRASSYFSPAQALLAAKRAQSRQPRPKLEPRTPGEASLPGSQLQRNDQFRKT